MKKIIIGIVAFFVTVFGLGKLIEAQEQYDCPDIVVTVQSGDTQWKIAENNCKGNIQVAVYHLVKKYGTLIHHGQQIQLP